MPSMTPGWWTVLGLSVLLLVTAVWWGASRAAHTRRGAGKGAR
ncbi:hypothetical protein [Streptomyces albiaxialis]